MKLIFMYDVFTVLVHFFDWYNPSISLSTKSIDVISLGLKEVNHHPYLGPPKLSGLHSCPCGQQGCLPGNISPVVSRVCYLVVSFM